jgi:hypothetical protein
MIEVIEIDGIRVAMAGDILKPLFIVPNQMKLSLF